MSRRPTALIRRVSPSRWILAVAAAGLLAVSGCTNMDLRPDHRPDSDLTEYCGQYRKTDRGSGPAAVTNKGMQIEQDLGYR